MNNFNTGDIEVAVSNFLEGRIGTSIYNNRPKAMTQSDDFVVVSVWSGLDDRFTYGECDLTISIFAKDVQCFKNNARLTALYNAILRIMPAQIGKYLISTTPDILADVPDDYGFTARILRFKVITKVQ